MSTSYFDDHKRALYLDEINIYGVKEWKFRVKLRLNDGDVDGNIDLAERAPPWTPSRLCEVPVTGSISVFLKAGVTVGGFGLGKQETRKDISGQKISEEFLKTSNQSVTQGSSMDSSGYFSLSEDITFHGHPATITMKFHPSQTSETTRQALHRVKAAMEDYSQLKANRTMQSVDTALKLAVAASEVNPLSKMAFAIARATFDLLREQQKYDDKVSDLVYRIERMLPFLKKVEELSYGGADLLKKVIQQANSLIVDTAEFAQGYVQQSFLKRLTNSAISPTDRKKIEELQVELANLATELDRAMEIETLNVTKDIDSKLLLERLEPVKAGYDSKRICMEGTRQRVIEKIAIWAVEPASRDLSQEQNATRNVLWLCGMPGIGKTSIANSVCSRLHTEKRLGGSFFCRRDDPKLGNAEYVLPTLTCRLAEMWGPFRKLVAEELSKDPQITPKSTGSDLLTRLLKSLKTHPPHPLVLVIDALDECGDDTARDSILRRAFDAISCVLWLKVIITSRQEGDINEFFQHPDRVGRYLLEDLSTDDRSDEDIRYFTQSRLSSIAAARYLKDWVPEHLVNKVVTRANGLYIFVETLWRLVRDEPDPETLLNEVLEETVGDALSDLYNLYTCILSSRVRRDSGGFRAIMGAILVVGYYRPLCAQTVAMFVGRQVSVVQTFVRIMSSLLYRDSEQNDGIRCRHLSIINFLTSPNCPEEFRVDIQQAHREIALACLNTMIHGLRFNICELKNSLLSNEKVKDMEDRIRENISDELQYSCIHWSSHLSLSPYSAHSDTMAKLDEFFEDMQPLYWIEVLSLMGKAPIGIGMLRAVLLWAKAVRSPALEYVEDALRFLFAFLAPITTSTPHIYVSALAFSPMESILWKKASRSFQKLIWVEKGRMKKWPARSSVWTGHTSMVNSLAYSPDGLRVVSGSLDNTIRIWDVETGAPVGGPLKGHTATVTSVTYSPDGRNVVSGSLDNTIRIWDAETAAPVGEPLKGHTKAVSSVAYSPDGRHIISGSDDNTIQIWDVVTGVPVGDPLKGHAGFVRSVAYSPDGKHVASSSWDETIRIWDAKTRIPVLESLGTRIKRITSLAYSPDGRHIASSSHDQTIRIWDVETGALVVEPLKGHTRQVNTIAYSPDGCHIVSGSNDNTIRIWDSKTGVPICDPLEGHAGFVQSVAYSPDGRYLVSGAGDNTIRIWNAETGDSVGKPPDAHMNWILSVAYSPDGFHIVSGSADNTIRIWDAETGAPIGEPLKGHTDYVSSVAYSTDGRHIVSGSYDQMIRIWDAKTGAPVGESLKGHSDNVISVAYSPDGRHAVSSSRDSSIRIWDVETGAQVGEPLKGSTGWVNSVAYSPDGRHVISGSNDQMIRIWDVETRASIDEPLKGHTGSIQSVAYSPDGRRVVSGSADGTIRIWDVEKGTQVGEPLKGHVRDVFTVAYSPDGRHIASGAFDKTIRIWDVDTGAPVGEPLKGHTSFVWSVAYSPDGRHIASSSFDKTIRIWDANIGASCADNTIQILNTEVPGQSITLDLRPDRNGWVHHPNGGLLFWTPDNCRFGLFYPAVLVIPTDDFSRVVRIDPSNACFGLSWEEIKVTAGDGYGREREQDR